jgi:hypothetical protein
LKGEKFMVKTPVWNGQKLQTPGTYRIKVQGCIDEKWSDRLGGMKITTSRQGKEKPVTTLVGPMRDQAQLLGVLNSLYELHLPLLSIELLKEG